MPDIIKVPRKDVGLILMGCDGIWEKRSAEQMTKWIHKKMEGSPNDLGKIL